jgi:uncharacterized Zn finger protein
MGSWSRSFVAAVAGNADNPELEVEALRVDPGEVWALVDGCEATITAHVIPARIWAQMARYAQGMGQLELAVEGRMQSVHLEHLLQEDWGELLIPRPSQIAQSCTCDEAAACQHVAAVAYSFADEIERTRRVLLRWRGVADVADHEAEADADPSQGKELGALGAPRAMPTYSVLKRLGPSEMYVGGSDDLAHALRVAYEALISPPVS